MLAYYVEHQLRAALSTVLFQDDDLDAARWTRDPVATAEPSASARAKKGTKTTDDGWPVQSLRTLLSALGTGNRDGRKSGVLETHAWCRCIKEPDSADPEKPGYRTRRG